MKDPGPVAETVTKETNQLIPVLTHTARTRKIAGWHNRPRMNGTPAETGSRPTVKTATDIAAATHETTVTTHATVQIVGAAERPVSKKMSESTAETAARPNSNDFAVFLYTTTASHEVPETTAESGTDPKTETTVVMPTGEAAVAPWATKTATHRPFSLRHPTIATTTPKHLIFKAQTMTPTPTTRHQTATEKAPRPPLRPDPRAKETVSKEAQVKWRYTSPTLVTPATPTTTASKMTARHDRT